MSLSIFNSLKKRPINIDESKEDPNVPIKLLHKMTEKQAIKEVSAVVQMGKNIKFSP